MVPRLLLPALPALVLALTGPGFDGCQGGTSGGPLPPGTMAACFNDDDCVPTGCEDLRCIASQCQTVAAIRDGDLDGHAPPPCGDDCDDTDSRVFPGQAEICDNRDQDCDMRIDEDAAPGAIATLLGTASLSMSAAAVGTSIVVTDTGLTPGARVRTVDFQGHVGVAVPVRTDALDFIELGTTASGAIALVGRSTDATTQVLEAYPIDVPGGVLTVHPSSTIATLSGTARARRALVAQAGSSFVVVWDDMANARWATMPAWTTAIMVTATSIDSLALDAASDGTSIAIPSSPTVITFYASTDASVVGTQTFTSGLAVDPVTVAAHDYIVAFRDAFDHQLAHMTPTSLSPMHSAPSQGNGLPLRVDETAVGPLLTRFDPNNSRGMGQGVWALVLPETLDLLRIEFPPSMVSAGALGTPLGFDVVAGPTGTAILTNFGMNGAVLTVLACQPHP